MKTYTYDDPELGLISYVDGKRYLWLISVLFPLVPLIGMGLMS
ncbi:MAG: alkane 1-monooxygenase, partial [Xanthomonadales bacterium]|nr:alkane 1-monooxygenase [Xanthomonadales bacterium]